MSTDANFSAAPEVRDSDSKMGQIADFVKQAFVTGKLSDVIFSVGRDFGKMQSFSAHKFVLCIRSSVFHTMFYGSLPEKCEGAIDIPDVHPDAFANLLSFLYTDAVDNLSIDNVIETMACADKYDVPQLMEVCADFVERQLNSRNCLAVLKNAVYWHVEHIVEKCLILVDLNSAAILQSKEFTDIISQDTVHNILKRDTLSAEENIVYLAVERWATEACARCGLDTSGANRRQMLGDALFSIRFPLLTGAQLADGPGKSGLLTEMELLSVFMYQNATEKSPYLAFPIARRTGVRKTFAVGEKIFLQDPDYDGGWWEPATITEIQPERLVYTWCINHKEGVTTPDKVIPVKDLLVKGQKVYVRSVGKYAEYDHAEEDAQHRVTLNGGRDVRLADLMLHANVGLSWMTKAAK
ncbi:BTB/POZ domain-containing protein 6-like [Paramacrobiotus metropolitanus]|uniref:BTB/POZ domain-containing protein 6-like n=1 Tax=Paramacrobiotus metropolitanus TaxID=2943436 RepID=UPI002445D1CE|nr:BTB/POZ domain-containing protein 6-like [Paramacrobiotus metropolitanus]